MTIVTTAKNLKVSCVIDSAPFVRAIPDGAPARTEVIINVGGRSIAVDLATRSIRKAAKALVDNGVDRVVLIVEGSLSADGLRIEECGLVANLKNQAAPAAAA
jgi:phosphopantothenate synthetase